MQVALVPMEGLVDEILHYVLIRIGGIDWCVTKFIRIIDRLLPTPVFHKLAPELQDSSYTRMGTPIHLQLLGSDPVCFAENATFAWEQGAGSREQGAGSTGDRSELRLSSQDR